MGISYEIPNTTFEHYTNENLQSTKPIQSNYIKLSIFYKNNNEKFNGFDLITTIKAIL